MNLYPPFPAFKSVPTQAEMQWTRERAAARNHGESRLTRNHGGVTAGGRHTLRLLPLSLIVAPHLEHTSRMTEFSWLRAMASGTLEVKKEV